MIQILSDNLFPVVGVGASAGGLDAFKELVKAIPEDSGMAYILVQHLAPQYESILAEILQKVTRIPVVDITDNIKVLPDHIYIIPSNKILTANDGVLQLDDRIAGEKINTIDIFLSSLAEVHQDHTIGVVLSGTGNDGTLGLKTIKDLGGITIAQDRNSAAYPDMPQNAIDAQVVDFVLSPHDIPERLKTLVLSTNISDEMMSADLKDDEAFKQILSLLKIKRGVDFTYYKQSTIRRRILRRKSLNKIEKLKDYQIFLLENKAEQDNLLRDILISVTAFFRDPKIFNFLSEKIFPELFKDKPESETIRIWVAGCSTGEEAYSLAILLYEYFGMDITSRKIQIFATDLSEESISKARSGIYLKKDIAGVSDERLKKFFSKTDGTYQVNKEIRQLCVFASQNFLKDPPFAKLDLISCRNVLIYIEPYLQKRALTTFHYALNPTGYLLLGRSETLGQSTDQFKTYSQQDKIYTKKDVAGKFMLVATQSSEAALKRKDEDLKPVEGRKDDYQKAADEALLAKYETVGVIVNDQLDILQFRGITSSYLEAQPGKASHNILKMAREGLAFELRNAIHKAKTSNKYVKKEGVLLDKGKRKVIVEVIPLKNTIELYFLILFSDESQTEDLSTKRSKKKLSKVEKSKLSFELTRIEQLEKDLAQAREDMRSITEDQESSNEELQSANEELLSGSEELQSLNEELETTKEEIQSSNEELTTLNQELIERNEQLVQLRKYADSVVTTIHEPLLVLTRELKIKSANKAFYEQFNLTEFQVEGKMFFEIENGRWNISGLAEKLQTILPNQSYFENFEVQISLPDLKEKIMFLNARQLKNESNNEQLILLAMQDITEQRRFSQELELQVLERTKELKGANLDLKQSNDNLQQFASIASHDLQEPLRKIKTFITILKKQIPETTTNEISEVIHKINISADRMSQLIKELLMYSRVAHGARSFVSTNLDEILKNVLGDLDLLIAEKHAVIDYRNPLPVIDAVPLQMNQLFYNLLTNSIKFQTDGKSIEIYISWKMLSSGEISMFDNLMADLSYIEIIVKDNGIGFEQEFADQIFQMFERLNALEDFEGTGMGLAICKKITENHHGHIYASAHDGQGAEFHIILPVNQ